MTKTFKIYTHKPCQLRKFVGRVKLQVTQIGAEISGEIFLKAVAEFPQLSGFGPGEVVFQAEV